MNQEEMAPGFLLIWTDKSHWSQLELLIQCKKQNLGGDMANSLRERTSLYSWVYYMIVSTPVRIELKGWEGGGGISRWGKSTEKKALLDMSSKIWD